MEKILQILGRLSNWACIMLLLVVATDSALYGQAATRVITDFNGYWSSTGAATLPQPNNRHNVIGFTYSGVVYSTGVNDVVLAQNVPVFTPAVFRALPLGVLPGTVGASFNLVAGNLVDGNASTAVLSAVNTITTKAALTDGINGLDLGTAISNLPASAVINIPINNIVSGAISDAAPDILIAAVGTPSNTDTYVFTDANGVTVGTPFGYSMVSAAAIGTAKLDLFSYTSGQTVANAVPTGVTETGGTREIKVAAFRLSQFGITDANRGLVAFLKITQGAGTDPAFIAYNAGSFTPRAVWEGDVSSAWSTSTNWLNTVVPNANIDAYIPVVSTPNVYPVISSGTATTRDINIASGASVTVNNVGRFEVTGSINNSGSLDVADGTLVFMGTSAQNIPANAFVGNSIKNLIIDNASGVTLQGATNLTGILSVQAGTFNTGNMLTLKSNAAGSAVIAPVIGTVAGEMTIERYIPARRAFRFLSSPVDGGTIRSNWQENGAEVAGLGTDITGPGGAANGFDPSGSNNPSMFSYW
ncbi:MAG TPA: hypothetical protein VGB44_01650, partial [Flavobacterium sp.]